MCEVRHCIWDNVIFDDSFSLLLGEELLVLVLENGADFSLEFLEHEGDIRALEFLAEVLINQ
jgi:hypothetical protein